MESNEQLSMLNDKIKSLEAQIELMKELVKAKDQVIEAIKAQPQGQFTPMNPITVPYIYPSIPTENPTINPFQPPYTITCQHEYPSLWGGTCPPSCIKCGQQSWTPVTYISSNSLVGGEIAPVGVAGIAGGSDGVHITGVASRMN